MFEVRWEIYTNRKWEYTKINTEVFYDLKEAIDFLKRKKEKIKAENWVKGNVVETQYITYLEI